MTLAKGITNATVPMGAIGVHADIYKMIYKKNQDKIEFFHGYTYSGHPLACAAGLATLEVYEEDKLFERAKNMERYFGKAAHSLSKLNVVKDVRNFGLVAGIELSERSKNPTTLGRDVYEECFNNGLMVRFTGNTIAISPPLIIKKNQIDTIFNTLGKAIKKVF